MSFRFVRVLAICAVSVPLTGCAMWTKLTNVQGIDRPSAPPVVRAVADRPVDKPAETAKKAEADVDFGPYMADLQRRIKRNWFPPRGQETRRVTVVFKIATDGTISNLRLERPSGHAEADKAAMQAVSNASPFHHLPEGAPKEVDIQFTFDYNVFGGGRNF